MANRLSTYYSGGTITEFRKDDDIFIRGRELAIDVAVCFVALAAAEAAKPSRSRIEATCLRRLPLLGRPWPSASSDAPFAASSFLPFFAAFFAAFLASRFASFFTCHVNGCIPSTASSHGQAQRVSHPIRTTAGCGSSPEA